MKKKSGKGSYDGNDTAATNKTHNHAPTAWFQRRIKKESTLRQVLN